MMTDDVHEGQLRIDDGQEEADEDEHSEGAGTKAKAERGTAARQRKVDTSALIKTNPTPACALEDEEDNSIEEGEILEPPLDNGHPSTFPHSSPQPALGVREGVAEAAATNAHVCSSPTRNIPDSPPAKRAKTSNKYHHKSTCVSLDAPPPDDSIVALRSGSTALLNVSVLMKAGNALYIVTKWRDKEYYGVLVDGSSSPPPHLGALRRHDSRSGNDERDGHHHHHQHRTHRHQNPSSDESRQHSGPVPGENEKQSSKAGVAGCSASTSTNSNNAKTTARGKKNKQSAGDNGTQPSRRGEDDENEEASLLASGSAETDSESAKVRRSSPSKHAQMGVLYEFPSDERSTPSELASQPASNTPSCFMRCTLPHCGFCFEAKEELRAHFTLHHGEKRTEVESIAVQTEQSSLQSPTTCSVGVDAIGFPEQSPYCTKCKPKQTLPVFFSNRAAEEKSLEELFRVAKAELYASSGNSVTDPMPEKEKTTEEEKKPLAAANKLQSEQPPSTSNSEMQSSSSCDATHPPSLMAAASGMFPSATLVELAAMMAPGILPMANAQSSTAAENVNNVQAGVDGNSTAFLSQRDRLLTTLLQLQQNPTLAHTVLGQLPPINSPHQQLASVISSGVVPPCPAGSERMREEVLARIGIHDPTRMPPSSIALPISSTTAIPIPATQRVGLSATASSSFHPHQQQQYPSTSASTMAMQGYGQLRTAHKIHELQASPSATATQHHLMSGRPVTAASSAAHSPSNLGGPSLSMRPSSIPGGYASAAIQPSSQFLNNPMLLQQQLNQPAMVSSMVPSQGRINGDPHQLQPGASNSIFFLQQQHGVFPSTSSSLPERRDSTRNTIPNSPRQHFIAAPSEAD